MGGMMPGNAQRLQLGQEAHQILKPAAEPID
jgi:hypothetical protein